MAVGRRYPPYCLNGGSMTTASEYAYWQRALGGTKGAITEGRPECGFWRLRRAGGWVPVAIWREDDIYWTKVGDEVKLDSGEVWMACAKHPITEEEYHYHREFDAWMSDPPADVPSIPQELDPAAPPPAPKTMTEVRGEGWEPAIGDNSGAVDPVSDKIAAVMDDIAAARRHFKVHPIKTKSDADKAENWRQRIYRAGKDLDALRLHLRQPLQEKLEAIQERFRPVLAAVDTVAAQKGELDRLAQVWIAGERERLRKEAEARARAEAEAAAAAAAAQREERERLERENPAAAAVLPEPDPEPTPVVVVPDVMIGTGARRRGAQAVAHTATIIDAKALAAHLVEVRHPDMMATLQSIANAAARSRARAPLPGCRMSWQTTAQDGKPIPAEEVANGP